MMNQLFTTFVLQSGNYNLVDYTILFMSLYTAWVDKFETVQ